MIRLLSSRIFTALLISIPVAFSVAIFMGVLNFISDFFQSHSFLVYYLPGAALVLAWLKTQNFFSKLETTHEIERELKHPERPISHRLAPAIILMSWWSHLFGASVGREMVAVQVGASVAENLLVRLKRFTFLHLERDLILQMGVAAGFSAIFASPFAAVVFVFEISKSSRPKILRNFLPILVSAAFSFFLIQKLEIAHLVLPLGEFSLRWEHLGSWLIYSILIVTFAGLYHLALEQTLKFLIPQKSVWVHFFGGLILTFLAIGLGTTLYNGMSPELMTQSFDHSVPITDALNKALTTLISIAAGFKGGEVVPLMVTGAAFGSGLSSLLQLPLFECAAVGISILFCFRLNCPRTGIVWVGFAFGLKMALAAALPLMIVMLARRKT